MDTKNQNSEAIIARLLLEGKHCENCSDLTCKVREWDNHVCENHFIGKELTVKDLIEAAALFDKLRERDWNTKTK